MSTDTVPAVIRIGKGLGRTIVVVVALLHLGIGPTGPPVVIESPPTASSADTDSTEEKIYCYVELSTGGASFYVTINDTPFMQATSAGGEAMSSPVNVRLVGENNELRVVAGPTMKSDSSGLTTPEDARLSGSVSLYRKGQLTGTQAGEEITTFSLQDTIEARREEKRQSFLNRMEEAPPEEKKELADREEELTSVSFPIEMTVRFDSPKTPSFAGHLTKAPVIEDTTALKDYAVKLRNLMRRQDTREIYEEMKVKNRDYNLAYYESDGYEWWKKHLEGKYFESGLRTDFNREDIGLRPLLDGRLWEVYVENGEPDEPWDPTGRKFFKTRGEDGTIWSMRVIVGRVDGELCIVR
ncbi:hypothetical protein BSZ35_04110 [Salinibacter sp. 10B]|uniref:hypothetical protein n=1 Tax=Salinibacter sp. 10B TaxID=1923971 RepID=UPI000CF4B01C|nr:hypothetical protein [Salinibacter sp. 10B]PQJ33894.1 hypothetical protein BSZ35_04110 [Salinibacter sp. 10B]